MLTTPRSPSHLGPNGLTMPSPPPGPQVGLDVFYLPQLARLNLASNNLEGTVAESIGCACLPPAAASAAPCALKAGTPGILKRRLATPPNARHTVP